jgi:hypothetical protein
LISTILTVAILGMTLSLAGCDSRLSPCRGTVSYDTLSPARTDKSLPTDAVDSIQVHLAYGFDDDRVTIELGDVTVFSKVVTSDKITAHTGDVVSLEKPPRPSTLRVTVNGSECAELLLDSRFGYVAVSRERPGDLSIYLANRAPLFD